ncbi:hypothetical protein [Granulicella sp. S190]|uniref:hypothetical protein n=1 Tax=Granulicella sp. S190 TaxID=1747226 RepID=UPI00131E903D|nr:hypothetical protein [Granulicella sp. S190]
MSSNRGAQRFVVSLAGAAVSFFAVATGIYYKIADVRMNGPFHGGPVTLAAAMAGLFGGGIVAVVVLLVLLLRRGKSNTGREQEP